VQLSLNFLTPPQPATPLERLEPGQRAELVRAPSGITPKPPARAALPMIAEAVTTTPTEGTRHD
jgi:hypothetical protein